VAKGNKKKLWSGACLLPPFVWFWMEFHYLSWPAIVVSSTYSIRSKRRKYQGRPYVTSLCSAAFFIGFEISQLMASTKISKKSSNISVLTGQVLFYKTRHAPLFMAGVTVTNKVFLLQTVKTLEPLEAHHTSTTQQFFEILVKALSVAHVETWVGSFKMSVCLHAR
jgi:hypothetical protein